MDFDEMIEEVVYAIFEGKISLNDPTDTIEETKEYLRKERGMTTPTTQEIYEILQSKLIIDLKEDEILCPECKGMQLVYIERDGQRFLQSCRNCHTGKLIVCKHCGEANKSQCRCDASHTERLNKYMEKKKKREAEFFEKAEKIDFKDYDGKFILEGSEFVKNHDEVEEWIEDCLHEGEEVPDFLWAVEGKPHFSIDLREVILNECEDGYEDMYNNLDTKSPLLNQAQELIDKWEKEQGERLYVYEQIYSKVIIIKDLVEEIRQKIALENRKEGINGRDIDVNR